jgi:hypothetical protein
MGGATDVGGSTAETSSTIGGMMATGGNASGGLNGIGGLLSTSGGSTTTASGGSYTTGGASVTGGSSNMGGLGAVGGTIETAGALNAGGVAVIGGASTSGGTVDAGEATGTTCNGVSVPGASGTLDVSDGNYVSAGTLQGYGFSFVCSGSSVPVCVTPSCDSTGCVPPFGATALCVGGTIAADTTQGSCAGVGFMLSQSDGGTSSTVPAPTSLTITYDNFGALPVSIGLGSGGTSWCVDTSASVSGQAIPITSFNTTCWNNEGTFLNPGDPIDNIHLTLNADASQSKIFSVCLTGVLFNYN